MRRSMLRLGLVATALALLVVPHSSPSQAPPDEVAARALLATNLVDALLNPAGGEDNEFFVRAGGVPNIFFLLDASGSMERLPPNGPASYGGPSPTMPPGIVISNPSTPPAAVDARTVGCGLDPVSSTDAAFIGNEMFTHIRGRRFYPPCGRAEDQTTVGDTYRGHVGLVPGGVNYAQQSRACPYYTPADSQAISATGGYDPDYYAPSPNNSQTPNVLWVDGLVYHESVHDDGPNGAADRNWQRTATTLGHNFGNGWSARTAPATGFPYQGSGNQYATIDEFCAEQGAAALPNGQIPSDVCKTCLKTAGWYYDGFILERTQDGVANQRYPSIWYTGNYLNFFPPKFLVLRKIVKDIVATQSKIRMALAKATATGMSFLKEFNPTCQQPDSNFDSNRSTYVNLVNGITFGDDAPLASAMFDVGRYYHSPGLPWFGAAWEKTGSFESDSNSGAYAICYSCQTSSVILLTDAAPPPNDGTALPPGAASLADALAGTYAGSSTGLLDVSASDCPWCAKFDVSEDYKNNLARVSWYMHNYDLRDNSETTKDCRTNGGRQSLDVYTVGYGTQQVPDANAILANAAGAGGGLFISAENAQILKQGLLSVFAEISGRSTSFSVATVSTLQTTSGHSVIVPRFDPAKAAVWEGHLYRYDLYSEFVNECDPSRATNDPLCCSPNGPGDYDCDGKCTSVFLQDSGDPDFSTPRFIQEGGDGFFYRNTPNRAPCVQAPRCVAAGKSCGGIGSAAATPWWDAGDTLNKRRWSTRKVFTVLDSNRDGRIDASDASLQLVSSNDSAATAILPYLGNAENRVCNAVASRIETAGDAATATLVRTSEVDCAKAVIRWVLGADVFNEAGRKPTDSPSWPPPRPDMSSPPTVGNLAAVPPIAPNLPDQEALPERPFKLGDIFHSSPVVVDPPLPRTGILCRLGLHNQCMQSLWRTVEGDADDLEYDKYAEKYGKRRKIVVVGSNDGLFHAFNGGAWHDGLDDPTTKTIDEDQWPFHGYYDRGGPTDGDRYADELWAFLPPDMIPKLPLVFGGEHQIFVDGSAMVRDVWADGTSNAVGAASAWDDVKQGQEFHTVAVVGERRGGTHYFALDLTDATKLSSEAGFTFPKFLWMHPQPDDRASLAMGETYSDFLPTPPPVGPVRIKADARSGSPKAGTPEFNAVPYHERWVAFLSGGFDQQYVKGRGVHMVDAWTGSEVFDFSYPLASAAVPASDPRWSLRFPIPATVGMVMWGPDSRRENGLGYSNAGFFDTATFGDSGGQLWVLRFHEPAVLGADGKATNWFGARAFQMGGRTNPSLGWAHPFFYITANTALPGSYIYRAYLGTGDRYNLLDQGGGVCAPDNIRACAMRGCNVDVDLSSNYASTPELGTIAGSQLEGAKGDLTTGLAEGLGVASVQARARIVVSACPSPGSSGATGFTKDVAVTCAKDGAGRWGCAPPPGPLAGEPLDLSNASNAPVTRNWYFSVRIFDDLPNPRIPFKTAAEAEAYDANRLWIRDPGSAGPITQSGGAAGPFTIMAASVPNPPVPVDPSTSAGWAIYYDHGPSIVAEGNSYTVNALDERTSSVSALSSILTWNTTQPANAVVSTSPGSCFVSKCTAEDRRVAYHYAAHPLTGGSILKDDAGNPIRAYVGNTLVPQQGDQPTVFVNQKGQVLVGQTVVNPEKGAGVVPAGAATDAVTDLGYIEVSEPTHACRHATAPPAAGVCR